MEKRVGAILLVAFLALSLLCHQVSAATEPADRPERSNVLAVIAPIGRRVLTDRMLLHSGHSKGSKSTGGGGSSSSRTSRSGKSKPTVSSTSSSTANCRFGSCNK